MKKKKSLVPLQENYGWVPKARMVEVERATIRDRGRHGTPCCPQSHAHN